MLEREISSKVKLLINSACTGGRQGEFHSGSDSSTSLSSSHSGHKPTTRGELINLFVPWRLVFAVKTTVAHKRTVKPSITPTVTGII